MCFVLVFRRGEPGSSYKQVQKAMLSKHVTTNKFRYDIHLNNVDCLL